MKDVQFVNNLDNNMLLNLFPQIDQSIKAMSCKDFEYVCLKTKIQSKYQHRSISALITVFLYASCSQSNIIALFVKIPWILGIKLDN